VKSIREYKNDVLSDLVIEYYESGAIKCIGHYETYPTDKTETIQIVDWTKKPVGDYLKDSVIHLTLASKPKGKWYYFLENGELHN
jgi:hypothetical protein